MRLGIDEVQVADDDADPLGTEGVEHGQPPSSRARRFRSRPYYSSAVLAGLAVWARPDADEVDRGGPHHRLAVLVLRLDERFQDAAIRFALAIGALPRTVTRTRSVSPGRTGFGQRSSSRPSGAQARDSADT